MTEEQLEYYSNEFAKIISNSSIEAIAVTQEFEDYLKSSSSIIVWSVFHDWIKSKKIKYEYMSLTNESPFRIKIKKSSEEFDEEIPFLNSRYLNAALGLKILTPELNDAARTFDKDLWESIKDSDVNIEEVVLDKELKDFIDRNTDEAFEQIVKDGVKVSILDDDDDDREWYRIIYSTSSTSKYKSDYLKMFEDTENKPAAEDLHSGKGVKADKGKRQWSLLPFKELGTVVDILDFGAEKYAPNNWQKVDNAEKRYEDALYRHMTSWSSGEKVDPESGKSHLAHVVCNALFLMWFENNNKGDKE